MIRTQIQLTEEQVRTLRSMAEGEGISFAELIRRSVDLYVKSQGQPTMDEKRRRALSVVGKYASDTPDAGVEHDRYLAESYGDGIR